MLNLLNLKNIYIILINFKIRGEYWPEFVPSNLKLKLELRIHQACHIKINRLFANRI